MLSGKIQPDSNLSKSRLRSPRAGGLFWQTDISPWFSNRAGLSAGLTSLMYIDMFSPDASTAARLSTFAQSQLDYVRCALPLACCCIDRQQPLACSEVTCRDTLAYICDAGCASSAAIEYVLAMLLSSAASGAGAGQQPELCVVRAGLRRAQPCYRAAPPLQHRLPGAHVF